MSDYTETEQDILAAALHVFAQKGMDGARMQEIADRAGVNKALLHYYFRNKAGLYDAVFGYVLRKFLKVFASAVEAESDFPAVLRGFIEAYTDFVARNPDSGRLILNDLLAGAPVLRPRLRAAVAADPQTPPAVFAASMRRAQASGTLREVDPIQTLLTAVSSCVFFFAISPIVEEVFPERLEHRAIFLARRKEHVFDVLMNGLLPRGAADDSQAVRP